jgi:hypothetical protein
LTLFVDFVKGIAWPLVVFAIVYVFRQPMKELLPRVRKAGPTGVEIEVQQTQVQVRKWSDELKEQPGFQRTPTIEAVEKAIHGELANIRDEQRIDLLANRLAVARLSGVFERVYGAIYGTQISGLRALVSAGGTVIRANAVEFFEDQKSKKPEMRNIEFAPWLEFLRLFQLIKVEGDAISITDLGRDFLLYLSGANLNEAKPF